MRLFAMAAWSLLSLVLFYGYPILIAWLWFMRWKQAPESPHWRWAMSWVSLSLATVALGAWIGAFTITAPDLGEYSERLGHGVYKSLTFSAGAFVAALLAKGKVRAWIATSALIIPVEWLMTFGLPAFRR